jgi:hypothetical protein
MKRLSEQLLLGGFLSGLMLFATASCSSSSSPPPLGGGDATGSGAGNSSTSAGTTGTNTNGGGSTGTSTGGNGTSQGGNGTVATGGAGNGAGSTGVGGSSAGSAGTGGGDATMCSTDPNLVNATGCFVGCDPTLSTDNPDGIQGAFYTYGDGSSCTQPLVNPPCGTGGICLSGSTVVDPTYAKWGCGIGLELNATGGTASVKQAYTGSASCFNYVLSGSSGGNEVRIAFTQTSDTTGKVSPYVSIPAFTNGQSGTICTKDVSCQGQMNCALTGMQYDLQIEVVGGNHAGAYNLCLTSLTPMGSGSSTLSQLCGAQGATNATEDVGKYFAQNNVNTAGDSLCITPALNGTAASFVVGTSSFATGATLNAYPSLVDGWHYGRLSSDTALPKAVSALGTVNSSVTYTGSDGKYDAAYDIWVLPTLPSASVKTPAGGLEVMLWLNHTNPPNPAGTQNGTFMGYNVWTGTVQNWNYVAYEATGKTSFSGDLAPFIKDAVSRKGTQTAAASGGPWLAGIEFGFELYDYPGTGFAVTSFTTTVQ